MTSAPAYSFVAFNAPGNPPPVVALTAPAVGSSVAPSAPVKLTATASDAHGIKKVEFYVGAKLVGTSVVTPYMFTWSTPTPGRYQVIAKATDTLNAATFTQPVFLTVK